MSIHSLQDLLRLDTDELHRTATEASARSTTSRLLLGRCFLALDRKGAVGEMGFSCSVQYAGYQGIDCREASELRRVAETLETLPELRGAAERGRVGWSTLREVTRKATPETDREWLHLATGRTYKAVERIVSRTRKGESPTAALAEDRDPVEASLRVTLPMEVMELFQRASRELCLQAGRRLSLVEIIECVSLEVLAGSAFPNAHERAAVDDALARDRAAQEERDSHEIALALPARVEAPVEALAMEEEPCGEGAVARPAAAHWANPNLRPSETARTPSPAQRADIVRRDAYCCANPECPHRLWLQVHHVVFYCDGGVTLPRNLITLCSRCHRNLHLGRLRVTGTAPGHLIWRDGAGRALGERFQ